MSKNIYVGNLSPRTTQKEIRQLFEQYGQVNSVDFITDRYTGTRRGFGFVRMTDEGARMAIAALDKQKLGGQTIRVNEADPTQDIGAPATWRLGSSARLLVDRFGSVFVQARSSATPMRTKVKEV